MSNHGNIPTGNVAAAFVVFKRDGQTESPYGYFMDSDGQICTRRVTADTWEWSDGGGWQSFSKYYPHYAKFGPVCAAFTKENIPHLIVKRENRYEIVWNDSSKWHDPDEANMRTRVIEISGNVSGATEVLGKHLLVFTESNKYFFCGLDEFTPYHASGTTFDGTVSSALPGTITKVPNVNLKKDNIYVLRGGNWLGYHVRKGEVVDTVSLEKA
ncbi:hypothetical protein [Streptomyces chartreusis]|uniref:hypothetical protein n=1 Tax=Streptomyces chartreusis TaxID=1969 RepID=UPI002E174BFC